MSLNWTATEFSKITIFPWILILKTLKILANCMKNFIWKDWKINFL